MPQNTQNSVTIEDVAKLADVSTATVSRVINRSGPVAEKTAIRVLDAIENLDYVPHSGRVKWQGGDLIWWG